MCACAYKKADTSRCGEMPALPKGMTLRPQNRGFPFSDIYLRNRIFAKWSIKYSLIELVNGAGDLLQPTIESSLIPVKATTTKVIVWPGFNS